jgi:[acyl-carrier-protein] S-malonyltransferase
VLAIVCPGQGAQRPGLLQPWLSVGVVADRLAWAGAVTGIDLLRAGTVGNEAEIRDTAVAQPLLVATALAVAAELDLAPSPAARPGRSLGVLAGHSVGEASAAALAGAMTSETALAFVAARGRAMAEAAAASPTGMAALIGGDAEEVTAAIIRNGLSVANVNGPGQVVAAGELDRLDALAADLPARVRMRQLSVAGAFHTEAMEPARRELATSCAAMPVADPRCRLLSNADGGLVSSGQQLRNRLIAQVSQPVRWDACMSSLVDLGVSAVIELPPAGTLSALIRRALPGVETLSITGPEDLPAARSLLAAHIEADGEPGPSWRLLVAPQRGTFRPLPAAPGDFLAQGSVLGEVQGRSAIPVEVVTAGVLVEWLACDGDPVTAGQPLVRLHPVPEGAAGAGVGVR